MKNASRWDVRNIYRINRSWTVTTIPRVKWTQKGETNATFYILSEWFECSQCETDGCPKCSGCFNTGSKFFAVTLYFSRHWAYSYSTEPTFKRFRRQYGKLLVSEKLQCKHCILSAEVARHAEITTISIVCLHMRSTVLCI